MQMKNWTLLSKLLKRTAQLLSRPSMEVNAVDKVTWSNSCSGTFRFFPCWPGLDKTPVTPLHSWLATQAHSRSKANICGRAQPLGSIAEMAPHDVHPSQALTHQAFFFFWICLQGHFAVLPPSSPFHSKQRRSVNTASLPSAPGILLWHLRFPCQAARCGRRRSNSFASFRTCKKLGFRGEFITQRPTVDYSM